jgi:predicted RNase H-like HicB family nuclease
MGKSATIPLGAVFNRDCRRPPENMPTYEVIIYWSDEDDAFIAEVPELPGCAADGRTYRQALANAEVIIKEWIATTKELGRPITAPKGRLVFA